MYTLRTINTSGVENNQSIGPSYTVVDRETATDEFYRGGHTSFEVYKLLFYNDGKDMLPLYRKYKYYIVSENGSTLSNLTCKVALSNNNEKIYNLLVAHQAKLEETKSEELYSLDRVNEICKGLGLHISEIDLYISELVLTGYLSTVLINNEHYYQVL